MTRISLLYDTSLLKLASHRSCKDGPSYLDAFDLLLNPESSVLTLHLWLGSSSCSNITNLRLINRLVPMPHETD
ncbi:hypothetical protein BpHYR1_048023 [Brachionus plicatilis]|uniref:Uncharacterized protein n=1 Tax=Brachionus plicatilis TaxID=10195 RepID=A0A3M7TAB5_BRAPC|nr:hypothetical protein BpHYR1_048023 [Brachionus plicatilis]